MRVWWVRRRERSWCRNARRWCGWDDEGAYDIGESRDGITRRVRAVGLVERCVLSLSSTIANGEPDVADDGMRYTGSWAVDGIASLFVRSNVWQKGTAASCGKIDASLPAEAGRPWGAPVIIYEHQKVKTHWKTRDHSRQKLDMQ